jgi:hypothetical protein
LRKAFDSCNHKILTSKLEKYGIKGNTLNWFKNYLLDRYQFVQIDDVSSNLLNVKIGVPQGSVLRPLLFLLYINDLPNVSNFLSLLFADDTTLVSSHENLDELINIVNIEFRKIVTYFRANGLALHPDKTKFVIFSSNSAAHSTNVEIFCNFNNQNENDPLLYFKLQRISMNDTVPAIKFLGVYIDPELNFKYHTKYVHSKLSKAIYALRSVKYFIGSSRKKSLYFALFHSHLNYACQIWSCSSESTINSIMKKQKIAIRLVAGLKYNGHTEPSFKSLEILPFENIIELANLQIMYHFISGNLPHLLHSTWYLNQERHGERSLRNRAKVHIPIARMTSLDKYPYFRLPRLWESWNHPHIKNVNNVSTFCALYKELTFSNMSDRIVCNRLFCPSCSRMS